MTAAQLIADNLASLPHPDGTVRRMAGFVSGAVLPEAMHEQVSRTATDIGEAIVYLLEQSGYTILTPGERPADESAGGGLPEVAHLHCSLCDARLLSVSLVNPSHALTNGRTLIEGISGLSPECPHV